MTRCIRDAAATWCKFCPEIDTKPKIARSSPVVAIFNSQIRMKIKKGLFHILVQFSAFCAIFNRQCGRQSSVRDDGFFIRERQILMGGRLTLDGGTRPPYNLRLGVPYTAIHCLHVYLLLLLLNEI